VSDFYDYLDHLSDLSDDAILNSAYMKNMQKQDPSLFSPAVMSDRTLPSYIPSTDGQVVPDHIWDHWAKAISGNVPPRLTNVAALAASNSKNSNLQRPPNPFEITGLSPNNVNIADSLAIWNSIVNKLQQHKIDKQNAGNVNSNVLTKGGIFTDKDIIDSANAVKNFVDTQHEIAKQNAKKESDNSSNTNVNNGTNNNNNNNNNSPDTPANVGNEGPQTPNNANNPPAGTNTDTKGTGTNAGTGAGTKGTNKKDTGNPIGNSVKEKVNRDSNKGVGTTNVGTNTNTVKTPKTAEQIAYDRARLAADIAADTERSAIIQDYYNKYGINKQVPKAPNTPQVTKTALSEPQRDYYRYLTGYHRMSPNQAILSMGLDPTKYTF
jgi:hypothetical protein